MVAESASTGTRERAPISVVEVITTSPIQRIEVVTEREAATAIITAEDAEPIRSSVQTNATVKVVELVLDHKDPNRVTIHTY